MPLYTQLKTENGTPAVINWYNGTLSFMLWATEQDSGAEVAFDAFDRDQGYTFKKDYTFTEEANVDDQTCWFIKAGDRFEAWR